VLLEIGARLHGGENPRLAGLWGAPCHIEETVRAYTDPDGFMDDVESGYELSRHCNIAFLRPPMAGRLRARPSRQVIESLESFHQMEMGGAVGEPVPTVIGWVAMVHAQRGVVDRDLDRLRRLERDGLYELDPV
jgi:hypothetical protein